MGASASLVLTPVTLNGWSMRSREKRQRLDMLAKAAADRLAHVSHHKGANGRRNGVCVRSASWKAPCAIAQPDTRRYTYDGEQQRSPSPPRPGDPGSLRFDLFKCSLRTSLVEVAVGCFETLGLFSLVPRDAVRPFLITVRERYSSAQHNIRHPQRFPTTPQYHNWEHAFDVFQCVVVILGHTRCGRALPKEVQLALVVAALLHDCGHGGWNNAFLVATSDPLTLPERCGREGTLEHYHAQQAHEVLAQECGPSGLLALLSDHISVGSGANSAGSGLRYESKRIFSKASASGSGGEGGGGNGGGGGGGGGGGSTVSSEPVPMPGVVPCAAMPCTGLGFVDVASTACIEHTRDGECSCSSNCDRANCGCAPTGCTLKTSTQATDVNCKGTNVNSKAARFLEQVNEFILATDMSAHTSWLARFNERARYELVQ
jgi:uncharacterized membrane protein YgcG